MSHYNNRFGILIRHFRIFSNSRRQVFQSLNLKNRIKMSYSTICINGNIAILNGYLKLPKAGQVRLKQHRAVPKEYKLKSVTVSQTPGGKYYASILFEYENQVQEKEMRRFLGLDFSMHELYRDSNGNEPAYPKYYRNAEEKLAREQRRLSKMQKGSNNRSRQRIKVAKLHEKVSSQRKDFLHKLSRQTADAYDCVCIESLDMKAMSQMLNFGKSVSDNGWGMFTGFLKYKLEEQGKNACEGGQIFRQQSDLFRLWLQERRDKKSCGQRVGLSAVWNPSRQRCKCGCQYQK